MLDEKGIAYKYREYTEKPLSSAELKKLFAKLKLEPKTLLRRRDKAFKELGLTGNESSAVLLAHMAKHPTLLERPIGVKSHQAVVGRPIEKLLEL